MRNLLFIGCLTVFFLSSLSAQKIIINTNFGTTIVYNLKTIAGGISVDDGSGETINVLNNDGVQQQLSIEGIKKNNKGQKLEAANRSSLDLNLLNLTVSAKTGALSASYLMNKAGTVRLKAFDNAGTKVLDRQLNGGKGKHNENIMLNNNLNYPLKVVLETGKDIWITEGVKK